VVKNFTKKQQGLSFDFIAPIYDLLASVASLGEIKRSRDALLPYLPNVKNCLIIGGGGGDVLEYLLKNKKAEKLFFIEVSPKMLYKAQKKLNKKMPQEANKVQFILADFTDFKNPITFDLIVANYFLDLFPEKESNNFVAQIRRMLAKDGLVLCADLYNSGYGFLKKQIFRFILFLIYKLFKFTSHLTNTELPPIPELFIKNNFKSLSSKYFFFGILRSDIWKK